MADASALGRSLPTALNRQEPQVEIDVIPLQVEHLVEPDARADRDGDLLAQLVGAHAERPFELAARLDPVVRLPLDVEPHAGGHGFDAIHFFFTKYRHALDRQPSAAFAVVAAYSSAMTSSSHCSTSSALSRASERSARCGLTW